MIPERRIHEEKKSVITAGFQNENDEFTRRKQLARTKIQMATLPTRGTNPNPNPNPNQAFNRVGFFPSFLPSGGRAGSLLLSRNWALGVASCAFVAAPCVDIKHSRVGVTRKGHCRTLSTVSWRHLEAPTNLDSLSKFSCSASRTTCLCSRTCSCSKEGPRPGFNNRQNVVVSLRLLRRRTWTTNARAEFAPSAYRRCGSSG